MSEQVPSIDEAEERAAAGVNSMANAAAYAAAFAELSRTDPHVTMRMLKNMWQSVAKLVEGPLLTAPVHSRVAALLLEQYFGHSGDWKRMERELADHLAESMHADPVAIRTIIARISKQISEKAREVGI